MVEGASRAQAMSPRIRTWHGLGTGCERHPCTSVDLCPVCIPHAWLPCRVSPWLCVTSMPVRECTRWRKVLEGLQIRQAHIQACIHAHVSLQPAGPQGLSSRADRPLSRLLAAENFLLIVH